MVGTLLSLLAVHVSVSVHRSSYEQCKIMLLGDTGVGKTALAKRFVDESYFDSTTIGVEFSRRTVNVDGKTVNLQIWDTGGRPQCRSVVACIYKKVHAFMVVYDVTDEGSFHSMQSFFVPEIRKRGRENAPVLLVGNKTDKCIGRAEDCQLAKGFAVDNKMPFLEVCAWEAKTVHRAFMTLVRAVMGRPCCPSAETEDCIPDICGDYGKLCDVTLVVQGTELPAHSQVLALESCFFRKMFADLLGDGQSRDGGTLRVPLDDSISVEDAKTLIAFLYHRRSEVDEVKEAELLTWMADKYDVPRLLWICETKLCEVADQMYNSMLAEERADQRARTVWRSTHEHLDAALWLSEAERLGMDRLVKSCRRLVLRPRQKRTETAGTATHIATSVRNLISDAVLKMQGVRFRRIFGRSSPLGELADD